MRIEDEGGSVVGDTGVLWGGDDCAPPPPGKGEGGIWGCRLPSFVALGMGDPFPMQGHCWGAAPEGVGGGAMQEEGSLRPPRVWFGVRAGFCPPFKGCGVLGG